MEEGAPGRRLAEFRKTESLSQRQLATELGVSSGFIGAVETGKTAISRRLLEQLATRFQISTDWLLTGTGQMRVPIQRGQFDEVPSPYSGLDYWPKGPKTDRQMTEEFRTGGDAFSLIRRFRINVSAGAGIIPEDDPTDGALAFSNQWLRANGIAPDLAGLVTVKGTSMEPVIPDGSVVLVQANEMYVRVAGIYAFVRDGEAFIKRLVPLDIQPDGNPSALAIESYAPEYPTQYVSGSGLADIRIVGRVRCGMVTF